MPTETRPPDATPAQPDVPAPVALSPGDQEALLAIARRALASAVGATAASARELPLDLPPELFAPADAFVTLTEAGELRGCCGLLGAELPLSTSVAVAADSAALRDPRFVPLTAGELPRLHLEVSVLGEPVPLVDPSTFRPGVHGVILRRDGRRALLLPEVATGTGWGPHQMFEAVSRKAGLPADAWQAARTRLYVFRTDRFGGPAIANPG